MDPALKDVPTPPMQESGNSRFRQSQHPALLNLPQFDAYGFICIQVSGESFLVDIGSEASIIFPETTERQKNVIVIFQSFQRTMLKPNLDRARCFY